MNRKYKLFFYEFIKNDGLYCFTALLVITVAYFYALLFGKSKIELFDWTIFFSIIATGILNWFAVVLKRKTLNSLEDGAKLCENYDLLLNQYVSTDDEQGVFLTYNNSKASSSNLKKITGIRGLKQKNNIVLLSIIANYCLLIKLHLYIINFVSELMAGIWIITFLRCIQAGLLTSIHW